MDKWYEVPGKAGTNVIYSRVRLVRNLKEYPFPGRVSENAGYPGKRVQQEKTVDSLFLLHRKKAYFSLYIIYSTIQNE